MAKKQKKSSRAPGAGAKNKPCHAMYSIEFTNNSFL